MLYLHGLTHFKDSHSGKKGLHSVILKMIKPWQGEVKYAACGHKEPLVFKDKMSAHSDLEYTMFFSVTACKEQRTSALKTGSSLSPRNLSEVSAKSFVFT